MNHSHIACWKDIQLGIGEEYQQVALIKVSLLTPEQEQWLRAHDLTIEDLLNGRYGADKEVAIQAMYKLWNDRLESNGLERCFSE